MRLAPPGNTCFSLTMEQSIGKSSRGPPAPHFVDPQTGERFYNAREAAQIVQGVSVPTMAQWFTRGFTRYGFRLTVRREPIEHHPRHFRYDAETHRTHRYLISEAQVVQMRCDLQAVGRHKPGQFTAAELDVVRGIVYRRRAHSLVL
jgi:hypothetical protein